MHNDVAELKRFRAFTAPAPAEDEIFNSVFRSSPARRRPARRPVVVALAAVGAALVTGSAFAWTGSFGLFGGQPVAQSHFSDRGQFVIGNMGAPGSHAISTIGTRAGETFYRVQRVDGTNCWMAGAAGTTPDATSAACPAPGQSLTFPSQSQPVLDFSDYTFVTPRDKAGRVYSRLAGLAADGVTSVGLLDAQSNLIVSTPVVGNVYGTTDIPSTPATQLVAFDAHGNVMFKTCPYRGCQP
jgi:hypothetical protein